MAAGGDLVLALRRRLPRRQQHQERLHRIRDIDADRALRGRDRAASTAARSPSTTASTRASSTATGLTGHQERRHRVDQARRAAPARSRSTRASRRRRCSARPTNAIDFPAAFASLRAEADTYATYANDITPTNANGGSARLERRARSTRTCALTAAPTSGASRPPSCAARHDHLPLDADRRDPADRRHRLDDRHAGRRPNFSGIGISQAERILIDVPDRDGAHARPPTAPRSRARSSPRAPPCHC